jgi:phosphatidate cytidylyltransferase
LSSASSSELAKRVLVGVVAAPIAIGIVLAGGAALAALLAVVAALAAWELFRIANASGLRPLADVGVLIAGVIPLVVHAHFLGLYAGEPPLSGTSLAVLAMLVLLAAAVWARGVNGKPLGAVAVTAFGAFFVGGTLSYAYALRYSDYTFGDAALRLAGHNVNVPSGALVLILPLVLTWASDIGAFAVGRTIGSHRLIPAVSPGKSVEGAIGGLVTSILISWLYVTTLLHPATSLALRGGVFGALLFGAIISAVAQLGDLTESLLKREAGVKDSSALIPGHGGVLDRVDSLLFVLPVAYVLLGLMVVWSR